MADDMDPYIYSDNDDLIVVTPTIRTVDADGLVVEAALTGRTDGLAWISTSKETDGTANVLHVDLSVSLVEVVNGGTYSVVMEGSVKTTHLAALANKTKLYRHIQFSEDYHTSTLVTYLTARPE